MRLTGSENTELEHCYHCGTPLGDDAVRAAHDPPARSYCCLGCSAAAQLILGSGLGQYYDQRTQWANRIDPIEVSENRRRFDNPDVLRRYALTKETGMWTARIVLQGITCPACLWLIESMVSQIDGVGRIALNYTTRILEVTWWDSKTDLDTVLARLRSVGFDSRVIRPDQMATVLDDERRAQLQRLLISGLFTAQIMMISIALYFGDWLGMDAEMHQLLLGASLILSIPVICYTSLPFFRNALRNIAELRVSVDLPIALALVAAIFGSLHALVTGLGETYMDSVAMLVTLLLGSRFIEFSMRKRAADTAKPLFCPLPERVFRFQGGHPEPVDPMLLRPGDIVRIPSSETVPRDGWLRDDAAHLTQSLLTGESKPIGIERGDFIAAGSLNAGDDFTMEVCNEAGFDTIDQLRALIDNAQGQRPFRALIADRIAGLFVVGVILLGAVSITLWWAAGISVWLPICIAVLVVTCPCAFSLASPSAASAVTANLASRGFLTLNPDTYERLAGIDTVVFDKTGTLTTGRFDVQSVEYTSEARCAGLDGDAMAIASKLERYSNHPIASAFARANRERNENLIGTGDIGEVSNVEVAPSRGIIGEFGGKRWYIGSREFVASLGGHHDIEAAFTSFDVVATEVFLANDDAPIAKIALHDQLRYGAKGVVAALQDHHIETHVLSGDGPVPTRWVANQLGIDHAVSGASPEQKLEFVQSLLSNGRRVLVVGDGGNDAAAVSSADVSVSLGTGASLTMSNANALIFTDDLTCLASAWHLARRYTTILKQNLRWAVAYNLAVVPLAMLGVVAPWMAAIGMSASSALVILNSSRLLRSHDAGPSRLEITEPERLTERTTPVS